MLLPAADASGEYSAAVSYNVLEHIEDHVGALRSMAELVRPGGADHPDRAGVHVRDEPRSTSPPATSAATPRRRCARRWTRPAWTIEKLHYANALGLIGYYGATSIFKLAPKEGPMVKVYDSSCCR